MPTNSSPDLRKLIAEALYPVSAYVLPAVCERFGLAPGQREEAMASKRTYVLSRLHRLSSTQVLQLARIVLKEYPNYELDEAVAKIDEAGKQSVTELTRRYIGRAMNHMNLSGHMGLLDFLGEIWPIDHMSSPTGNEANLADSIVRHTQRNDDWQNDELLEALGAYNCSQRRFFSLLEAIVHPRTRSEAEQRDIVDSFNKLLHRDGFALLPTDSISGYPIFSVRTAEVTVSRPADAVISSALAAFDQASVHAAWTKALDRRDKDPEGAITAARTLLETVCKHIIEDAGGTYDDIDDLPKLYRTAAEHLNLAPDQHTETVFKAILGNCQSIVNNLGSLRNKLSDAHGKGRKPARPLPRHAELVVNLAGTMATFLVSTWQAKQADPAP